MYQVFAEELCIVASPRVSLTMAVPHCAPAHQQFNYLLSNWLFIRYLIFSRWLVSVVQQKKQTLYPGYCRSFWMELQSDEALWPYWKHFLLENIQSNIENVNPHSKSILIMIISTLKVWDQARCQIRNPFALSRYETLLTPYGNPTWSFITIYKWSLQQNNIKVEIWSQPAWPPLPIG